MARIILDTNNVNNVNPEEVKKIEAIEKPAEVNVQENEKPAADPYAGMFASWDLLPPQVGIRRIRRK